jgi:hypothetical protein
MMALSPSLLALAAIDLEGPRRVRANDAEFLSARRQRFEVLDRRAGLDPGAVGLPLLLDLDLAHRIAHRTVDLAASIGHDRFESFLWNGRERLPAARLRLAHAKVGELGR